MKKLLVLLVVLGLVSTASAGIVDLQISGTVAGGAITPVKEITIGPSDTVLVDITYNSTPDLFLFSLTAFVNMQGPGTLDLSGKVRNAAFDGTLEATGSAGGQQWIVEAGSMFGPPGTGQAYVVVSGLKIHCEADGTVTVVLGDYLPGGGLMEVNSSFDAFTPAIGPGLIIHQIPEPMTLMLLGLGSLFLVRRKK